MADVQPEWWEIHLFNKQKSGSFLGEKHDYREEDTKMSNSSWTELSHQLPGLVLQEKSLADTGSASHMKHLGSSRRPGAGTSTADHL